MNNRTGLIDNIIQIFNNIQNVQLVIIMSLDYVHPVVPFSLFISIILFINFLVPVTMLTF